MAKPSKKPESFPIELNLCEMSVRFDNQLVDGCLVANIYDASGKYVRPLGTFRIRRDQWPALKKHGDTLLGEFPRYLMSVNEKQSFMTLQEAGVTYDSGWGRVDMGSSVLESDFSVRKITKEEEKLIIKIADAHSASK